MEMKDLNKLYISAIRSRKKSGARWQKVGEVTPDKVSRDEERGGSARVGRRRRCLRRLHPPTDTARRRRFPRW